MNKTFHSILVGDDGSEEAKRAVDAATGLASCLSATLTLLGVLTPPTAEQQAEGYGMEEHHRLAAELESMLQTKAKRLQEMGIAVSLKIVRGTPEEEIPAIAHQTATDLIVVGHRDISRFRHWIEGSTSEALLRDSKASLLIVR